MTILDHRPNIHITMYIDIFLPIHTDRKGKPAFRPLITNQTIF